MCVCVVCVCVCGGGVGVPLPQCLHCQLQQVSECCVCVFVCVLYPHTLIPSYPHTLIPSYPHTLILYYYVTMLLSFNLNLLLYYCLLTSYPHTHRMLGFGDQDSSKVFFPTSEDHTERRVGRFNFINFLVSLYLLYIIIIILTFLQIDPYLYFIQVPIRVC
jgi:hypothetical protein